MFTSMGQCGNLQYRSYNHSPLSQRKAAATTAYALKTFPASRRSVSQNCVALLARAFVKFMEPSGDGLGKTQLLEPIRIYALATRLTRRPKEGACAVANAASFFGIVSPVAHQKYTS